MTEYEKFSRDFIEKFRKLQKQHESGIDVGLPNVCLGILNSAVDAEDGVSKGSAVGFLHGEGENVSDLIRSIYNLRMIAADMMKKVIAQNGGSNFVDSLENPTDLELMSVTLSEDDLSYSDTKLSQNKDGLNKLNNNDNDILE